MEFFNHIIRFFQAGGIFMYPIALVLALAIAVTVERLIFLGKAERENKKIWAQIAPQLAAGDIDAVGRSVAGSDTAIAKVLASGLSQAQVDNRRSEVEIAVEEGLMEVLPAIERRTHYLATFSNMSTLLGLLGTVLGLISAFSALSSADPAEKADLLSKAISEAMNCTAFGLITAIPALLIHAWLSSRTTELVDTLESVCSRFVSAVCKRR